MAISRGYDAPINELDLLGDGGGGLGSFMFNYGPSGAPNNAPPTAFERGITRADPNQFPGLLTASMDDEMPPPGDDQRPRESPGGEDSPFDIIMRSIVGEIGNPEGISPEVVAVLNGFLDGSSSSELEEVGRQIVEAGGFEEWLATQDIVLGDPGGVDDTTQTSTEVIFDENGNPVEIVIDPTLITLPPILGTPEDPPAPDPSGGGGGTGGGTEGGGDNTSGGGSVEGSEGNQDSINDGFFRVEDGTVYIRDLETNEWIIFTRDLDGLLGENPSDGYYTDTGVRIDDGSEVNVGGDDESSGGGNVTIIPGTGGTSGTSGTSGGGGNQSGGGTGGTGGGNQTGNPGDGTAGSGGGSNTGTGTSGGSGSGPGDGTGGGLFKDAVKKFQGVDATVRFNDPGIPQLIGGQRPQRQSIMGLFQEYL